MRRKSIRLFSIDNEPFKIVKIYRATDEARVESLPTGERKVMAWSSIKKYGLPVLTTKEVAALFDIIPYTLTKYVRDGIVEAPWKHNGRMLWTRQSVVDLHAAILRRRRPVASLDGRRRRSHKQIPSLREVLLPFDGSDMLYVRSPDGSFIPTWKVDL